MGTWLWWMLFALACLSFTTCQVGRIGSLRLREGLRSLRGSTALYLQFLGTVATLVCWILGFVLTGWLGGLVILLGSIPVVALLVFVFFSILSPETEVDKYERCLDFVILGAAKNLVPWWLLIRLWKRTLPRRQILRSGIMRLALPENDMRGGMPLKRDRLSSLKGGEVLCCTDSHSRRFGRSPQTSEIWKKLDVSNQQSGHGPPHAANNQ